MNGPATDHFFRSGEWKRNPPFFVPTATTTLPFLIERAMSTTGDAGEDVDDVSRIEPRFRQGRSDEFLVHEDVHVRPAPARLVDDALPDSREAPVERAQHRHWPGATPCTAPPNTVRRAVCGRHADAGNLGIAREKGHDVGFAPQPAGGWATQDLRKVRVRKGDTLARHGVPRPVADAAV